MAIIISFIAGFLFAVIVGAFGVKHMAKKGHYASAIYDKEKDVWTVRGRLLAISGKVAHRLRDEDGKGVKYLF